MPFVKVASLAQMQPDSVIEVTVEGNQYAICNRAGEITALSGICLHRGGPLGHGQIQGENVVCPWHMWEFNCRTGENDFDPRRKVPTYGVKVEGEDILLDVPEDSARTA